MTRPPPKSIFLRRAARRMASISFVALICAQAIGAGAETGPAARQLFTRGVELFGAANFSAALDAFRGSHDARPNPALRFNIGVCLVKLERWTEARQELGLYLAETDPGRLTSKRRQQVTAHLAKADSRVALIELDRVDADAVVHIDDLEIGTTPRPVIWAVAPGGHRISVALDGHATSSEQVTLEAGQRHRVDLRLEQISAETEESVQASTVATGRRRLSSLWFWGTLGLTVGLAAAGTVTGALVLGRESAFEDAVTACQGGLASACDDTGPTIADEGHRLASASNALFISAGITAAAALVLLFFTDWSRGDARAADASVGVTPLFGASGLGLALGALVRF